MPDKRQKTSKDKTPPSWSIVDALRNIGKGRSRRRDVEAEALKKKG